VQRWRAGFGPNASREGASMKQRIRPEKATTIKKDSVRPDASQIQYSARHLDFVYQIIFIFR
jgi:hypothetical protein